MTLRDTMTAIRDWSALLGAVAMVGFLTFVPQRVAPSAAPTAVVSHPAATDWPSRTAEMRPADAPMR